MEKDPGRYQKKPTMNFDMMDDEDTYDEAPRQAAAPAREEAYEERINDEEIFPGLFTSDISSWKKQFTNVYHVEVKGKDFIYRQLSRFEYKEIIAMPNTDPLMREEMICEYCVLYPQGYDFSQMGEGPAGEPAVLSESIMDVSGFTRDIKVTKL